MNIKIKFPDGSIKDFPKDISPYDVAMSISPGLARNVVAARVNDKLIDLNAPIGEDASIELYKFDSEIGREVYWHSTAHLMAQAVQELFPDVKVTIGPAIEQGFYYDFDKEVPFTDADLVKIEAKMKELSKQKLEYKREEITREEGIKKFADMGESYKVEILNEIPEGEIISLYTQGKFTDLCRGPHLPNTGMIKAVKLLKTSGAYWRGDEKNKMLQRIYGISFPSNKELNQYLEMLEEAKKRDHRKLGKELNIYSISDEIGPGLVMWHPNGALMRSVIEDYWKKRHFEDGYDVVNTPHIGKKELWETSGHLQFYEESMYSPIVVDEKEYYLKPMNCPFHIAIYQSEKHSYRDLPIKMAEMGTVYRYEKSGALHGLMRVRGFTQDDAHIICTPEQLDDEIMNVLKFSIDILKAFGFENMDIYLSTMPEKAVGEKADWDKATSALEKALKAENIDYKVDEGGGAFYGPKIDIKIKDALNRSWQCSTIQFDFNLPERFGMEYIGADNQPHRPFMVHRALLGSMERFFGTLIEYHAGNFPLWLCPVQVEVIPISEHYEEYAREVNSKLKAAGIRSEIDLQNEKIGYKIRAAEMRKIPYMFIVGAKEQESGKVSVRCHGKGDLGSKELAEITAEIKQENDEKK
ncbi:MAG: threonine--tRNA ligase [Candidatus Cloacimonetes bacterium]|nr:threonine--tRNA ligase [Candidatus Cloacimonadota bacterium]MCF7813733.1 threonine--tRNA ligase [Candidatus Cloacimonadota bacterium]MCF7867799.1 threonine--tRNA ligase [Candidatus Cloacimonadota bacterium]MCF7883223.1 threonine--tRNA ligase [Candidatus Cloacimonadota bacterium]